MTPEQQQGQMPDFCKKRGLKRETFRAYVRNDNPRKLGVRPGRPRLLLHGRRAICGRLDRDE